MPPDDTEDYVRLIQDERNELEEMCSMQMQEIEALEASLKKAKRSIADYKKKLAASRRAGDKLHAFIDELICADLVFDELLDKANAVCDNWETKGR